MYMEESMNIEQLNSRRVLQVAIPQLHMYHKHTGIGRVFFSISRYWKEHIQLQNCEFATVNLPLIRNFPYGIKVSNNSNFILLPKLTWGTSTQMDTRHT